MFAAKMVCFIQKLLGRDDTATDETGDYEISSLESQTIREQRTASDDIGQCCIVPDGERWKRSTPSEGIQSKADKLNVVTRPSDSPYSSTSSAELLETERFCSRDTVTRRQLFRKHDPDLAVSRCSTCELSSSSSSCELTPSSKYHLQCKSSDDDAGAGAEPVCCCDTCTSIANIRTSYKENHVLLSPLTDVHYVSNVLPPSSSCGELPSGGLLHPRSCLPSSILPVTCSSSLLVKSSSTQTVASTTKEVFHFDDKRLHGRDRDLDTFNLPPMICISPDGEEPFGISQRVLQNVRSKPFSEVPPNKTICHVHCKFVNNK